MNRRRRFRPWARAIACSLAIAALVTLIAARWNSGSAATEWVPMRLPFAGKAYISNGPNCTTHRGASAQAIDFPLEKRTAVLAAQTGTVEWAGQDPAQPSFGKLLKIRHVDGTLTWYAHLDEILKRNDEVVTNGERVAWSGDSGGEGGSSAFDAHLHFEVRDQQGAPVAITSLPGVTWFSDDFCGTGDKPVGFAIGAPPSSGQQTLLWFELLVPGIGRAGTRQPIEAERTKLVRVALEGVGSRPQSFQVNAHYEPESGSYTGVAELGETWATGSYWIVLRMPNTLGKSMRIIPTIRNGTTTVLPKLVLKPGDADDNNILDAFTDYKVLSGCYSVHRPPTNCGNDAARGGSDLNDDGRVDYEDHDLFITMVSVREGD